MRRRIFWSMVAVAAATLLVGGLTTAYLIGRSVEDSRRGDFLRQAEATGQLLDAQLGPRPGPGRPPVNRTQLFLLLEAARTIGGHDFVEASFEGRGGVDIVGARSPLMAALPERAFERGGEGAFRVDVEGRSVLAAVRQIPLGDRGTLVVAVGNTQDLVPWGDVVRRLLLGLGVGVALAAILATWLARSTGDRLVGLAGAARSIAGGDLGARAPVEGGDEVTEVATAFNDMAHQLQEARQRERDFLMSVGHDLRTPLTTIRGYAEALADEDLAPADLPRVAAVLEGQSDRLSRLVEDLMLLARLEAREFTLRPEQVDLGAHLGEVAEAFRAGAEAAGVRLVVAAASVGTVEVDPDRVGQMLANLIENALRYTPPGGEVTVRTLAEPVGFEVGDSGPGIDPEDLPHVFERLFVAERYRPLRPEGSGLGLNLVKELAAAMGGRVGVDSGPGRGTRIWVHLG